MRKVLALLFVLSILRPDADGQTSFELLPSLGRTYTPSIPYQNCTGHFSPANTLSFSFVYHPHPSWGFEISLSSSKPTTYLDDSNNSSVSVYTRSVISIDRYLTGINYSIKFKRLSTCVGGLVGFTHAMTTQTPMTNSYTSFSWSCQVGVDFYFNQVFGLRLNGAIITTPNISNNSAYFNVDKTGSGFPTFAVGDPSTANIKQWNISLGLTFRIIPQKKNN